MQGTVVAPNDKAGTQGIGTAVTAVDTLGMAGQYGGQTWAGNLSHGIGVNHAQFSGSPVRPDDRAGARPSVPTRVPTSFAAAVSTTGGGFSWGSAGIGAAGLASLALAIGLLVVLGRRSRHEGVAAS
jgi:hypothetical protein